MPTPSGRTIRLDLVGAIRRCRSLISEGNYPEARALGLDTLARAKAAGLAASQPNWCVAVASDNLGDLQAAAKHIIEAVAADPLAPEVEHSRTVVMRRLREAVSGEEPRPDIAVLYRLLLDQDETDPACHIAWARHQHRRGESDAALALLGAVAALHPRCEAAWLLLRDIAAALGRPEVVAEARVQMAALEVMDERPVTTMTWGLA